MHICIDINVLVNSLALSYSLNLQILITQIDGVAFASVFRGFANAFSRAVYERNKQKYPSGS
jgi:hypothetical protein